MNSIKIQMGDIRECVQ